jgi:hypothetical protein
MPRVACLGLKHVAHLLIHHESTVGVYYSVLILQANFCIYILKMNKY